MAEKLISKLCDYGSSMDESADESKTIRDPGQLKNKVDSLKNFSTHEPDDQKSKQGSPIVESKLPRQYRKPSKSSSHERSSSDRSKHGDGSRRHRRSSSRSRSHRGSHVSHRHRDRGRERRHRQRRRRDSHGESSHRRRKEERRHRSPSSSSSSTSDSRRDRRRSARRERDRDTGFSRKIIGSRSELARVKESVRPVDPVAARLEAANKASAIMASAVKLGESNPQEVLARFQETQMAQVRAKAEAAAAAVNLPSFYNPMSVNAAKLAEQQQKRKLLWSRKAVDPSKEAKEEAKSTMWKTTSMVAGKGDSAAAAKFCKLMGIHESANPNGKTAPSSEALNQAREQADLFRKLEHEYEQSRTLTHTQRGVGLGYSSAMTDFSSYNAMKHAGGASTSQEDE
ncbi:hypothetical protein Aperf_G00000093922 [Anoplocephala perfoliata]